jgi:hypothetical protein
VAHRDLAQRGVGEVDRAGFVVERRQAIFDRLQRLHHLPGQEGLDPLPGLGNRHAGQ